MIDAVLVNLFFIMLYTMIGSFISVVKTDSVREMSWTKGCVAG